jgi:hypothetical protein
LIIKKILTLLVAAIVFQGAVFAKERKSVRVRSVPQTLEEYIDKVCAKNCVDADHVLMVVTDIAEKYNIDRRVLLSIMRVESRFDKKARNKSTVGLMQVHLKYHRKKFPEGNYFDVAANINAAAEIYGQCARKHRTVERSLKCYNGGGHHAYSKLVLAAYKDISRIVESEL